MIGGFRSDLSITLKTSGNSAWLSGDGIADIPADRYFNYGAQPNSQVQWNLDLTKSLGTGQICSLNGGFVILKTSI